MTGAPGRAFAKSCPPWMKGLHPLVVDHWIHHDREIDLEIGDVPVSP
jgi:hypothetical protein